MAVQLIAGGEFDAIWISRPDGTMQDCRNMVIALGADFGRQQYDVTTVGSAFVQSETGPESSEIMLRVRASEKTGSGNDVSSVAMFQETSVKIGYVRRGEAWACNNMKVLRVSEPEDYARTAVKTVTLVTGPGGVPTKGTELSPSPDGAGTVADTSTNVYAR